MNNFGFRLPRPGPPRSGGFTLIELLVVIGIIAALAALLFPVAGSVVRKSKLSKCTNNLRQQQSAAMMYASDNGGALPQAVAPGLFFCREVAPYLGLNPLYGAQNYPVFMCPERPIDVLNARIAQYGGSITYGGYCYNPWVCGIIANNYPVKRLAQFSNPANTWMAADGNAQSAPYLLGAPQTIETRIAYDHQVRGQAKAQIVMLDGHVEFRTVDEMKANLGNFWADPSKPQ